MNVTEMVRVHLWIELPIYFQLSNFIYVYIYVYVVDIKYEISKH